MANPLDCVVVGYNDASFTELLKRNFAFREASGGYRHLLANSLQFRGKRRTYFEVLNLVRAASGQGGEPLHVAKMPNLAVCYLVSYLQQKGLRVEYANSFNYDQDQLRDLLRTRPNAVAITTTFYFDAAPIQQIVEFVRAHSPTTKVVVGGPHVFNVCSDNAGLSQDLLLKRMGADIYVFDSQGEETLAQLCLALRHADPALESIPNLILHSSGRLQRTARVPESNNMNANPVDWTRFDHSFLTPTAQTRTARSCAYKCAFCRYPVMAGALDLMTLETIEHELDTLQQAGTRWLLFIDDTFNVPVNRFKDICRLMIRKQYGFRWFSYFRCANADAECFDLMAESGCAGVFLGIESGDDSILKSMNKVASAAKYREGIRQLNARDIITYASFIIGFPPETEATALNTIQFIEDTKPSFYCLETFFYDPKVPIAGRAEEFGLSGAAYSWRHNSMDWRSASDLVERGYRTISGSTMVPLYGFDLWSIAYLLGQGLPRPQITAFLQNASRLLIRGLSKGDMPDSPADEQALCALFAAGAEPACVQ